MADYQWKPCSPQPSLSCRQYEVSGVKFKDADLIGIPVRITVGKRAGEGVVEYKLRRDADKSEKSAEEAVADTIAIVNAERTGRNYMK